MSVERDGGRSEDIIIDLFRNRFWRNNDYRSAVKISAGNCRNAGTFPTPIGNKKNIYHAEIWDSEDVKKISLLKSIRLAASCTEI